MGASKPQIPRKSKSTGDPLSCSSPHPRLRVSNVREKGPDADLWVSPPALVSILLTRKVHASGTVVMAKRVEPAIGTSSWVSTCEAIVGPCSSDKTVSDEEALTATTTMSSATDCLMRVGVIAVHLVATVPNSHWLMGLGSHERIDSRWRSLDFDTTEASRRSYGPCTMGCMLRNLGYA